VATATAFYDQNYIEHVQEKVGWLGYFEALPNEQNAVSLLFERVGDYLKSLGAEKIWGPMNGNIANAAGLLLTAYNRDPIALMSYNPSYYAAYFRRNDFVFQKELIAFSMDLLNEKLERKIDYLLKKTEKTSLKFRHWNMTKFDENVSHLNRIYSESFKKHWGYTPQSDEEVKEIFESLRIVIEPRFIWFAELNEDTVGFVLCVPDYNPIVKNLKGNVNILTSLSFLRQKKKLKEARLIAIGVEKSARGHNVAPILVAKAYKEMMKLGYTTCEYSWVLDDNLSSQNVARKFYGDDYKKYGIYEKVLN
jgi:ribosomal protein S18 acetylase RimI-like enzyme